jgi:7-carboxy-7-deazaguanine synthase
VSNDKLRLSEHYASVQGEGPRVGQMTQFVRFAGCNMQCPLWPCDTQHAIDPKLYRPGGEFEAKKIEPVKLAEAVLDMATETGATNICLTGGEPFLQKEELLHEFYGFATNRQFDWGIPRQLTWEVFSNGSFPYPAWAKHIHKVLDWKLGGSGEAQTARPQRVANVQLFNQFDVVKFTIKTIEDLHEATALSVLLENQFNFAGTFWVGRVWDADISDAFIIDYIKEMGMPWRLTVQVHKFIWPPAKIGV